MIFLLQGMWFRLLSLWRCSLLLMINIAKKYRKGTGVTSAPSGAQNFMEPIIIFIREEVAKVNLGNRWERYMPYLLTVFFFILINTLFGLIPGAQMFPEILPLPLFWELFHS